MDYSMFLSTTYVSKTWLKYGILAVTEEKEKQGDKKIKHTHKKKFLEH